ncbi:AAA family ATPase, partial [Neisseria meningitidis]|nr:AAA family ATPase [Neisseria meningitidis]
MRLTHIKLSGFKSFTDPTTIHVPGQLVAVIGPNGCGKSNVIDAVRWVLGEASAKQLRGESMQDVIFNGAATRRPAPRASVELVFDNSDHSLQGAWGQYAEVSIKRQLTRQGESTYFINNQTVRRRDITDLFLGTGVGARGYAVIEQGMISRIIEARPEELRAYIEEAAGVSKYKERRKETESRLKDTREHLQRLGDLQNELARQVEKLEKQAETAERYKSLTAQLNQQQDLLDYAQWQQSLAAADKATAQHQSLQAQQDETAAQVQALNDEVHALQTAEQSQQQAVHELSNKRGVLREQIARLEEQIRHQQNLHQRIERDKQAAQAQMQRIHQEQQQIRVQLEENELQAEEKQTELAEWAMQVAEHEERLPELEETQATLNAAFQTQQDEANRIRRELALKQQQLAHAEQTVAKHEERKGSLKQENQALNLPDEVETAAAQEAAALLQSQQEHYEEQIIAAEEALHAAREAFQTTSSRFQSLKQQHITLQAQQQALSQILSQQQEAADFWQATDYAAAPQLWQHITAPAEWQHALSVI